MAIAEKQLAQARENSTNAVSVYSPGAGVTAVIKTILIVNTTGSSETYRLFCDNDGTTYDESTALAWEQPITANTSLQIDGFFAMNNSSGNFAYRSSTANAVTISLFGYEVT